MIQLEKATFAGGCFWCMVKPFTECEGVKQVITGYTGGHSVNPTYQQVCLGNTGHTEAVEILFDPVKISYCELLTIFWQQIDPTDGLGQFADRGDSYRPAIFYHNEQQHQHAVKSKIQLQQSQRFARPIRVAIEPVGIFYPAEEYHQNFHQKQPEHYSGYYQLSGRADFIEKHWYDKQFKRKS